MAEVQDQLFSPNEVATTDLENFRSSFNDRASNFYIDDYKSLFEVVVIYNLFLMFKESDK